MPYYKNMGVYNINYGGYMMGKNVIEVKQLSKSFGTTVALDNCDFVIRKGEIFGFLGPSGAGKTTTIKLLTGQLKSDGGDIQILGENPFSSKIKNQIGIMSDNSGLYEKMSVYDNLLLFTKIYDIDKSCIEKVLEEVDLLEAKKQLVSQLSKGMRQRLIFARTIIHSPSLLFLDEPTANLDPSTANEVREIIKKLNAKGTTVFLTTHNMEEADEMCHRVAFLNHGHIIESGQPEELKLKYSKQQIRMKTNQDDYMIPLDKDILKQELEHIDHLLMIHSVEPTLKEVFLSLTKEES